MVVEWSAFAFITTTPRPHPRRRRRRCRRLQRANSAVGEHRRWAVFNHENAHPGRGLAPPPRRAHDAALLEALRALQGPSPSVLGSWDKTMRGALGIRKGEQGAVRLPKILVLIICYPTCRLSATWSRPRRSTCRKSCCSACARTPCPRATERSSWCVLAPPRAPPLVTLSLSSCPCRPLRLPGFSSSSLVITPKDSESRQHPL